MIYMSFSLAGQLLEGYRAALETRKALEETSELYKSRLLYVRILVCDRQREWGNERVST